MFRFRRALLLPLATLGCLLISACGAAAGASSAASTAVTQAPPAATSATATTPSPGSASVATQKVNANTGSQAELQAAFTAAGISNAARWAGEVVEYRPYPTEDPTFAKLRAELAKYNPGQTTVDQIVATLTL